MNILLTIDMEDSLIEEIRSVSADITVIEPENQDRIRDVIVVIIRKRKPRITYKWYSILWPSIKFHPIQRPFQTMYVQSARCTSSYDCVQPPYI